MRKQCKSPSEYPGDGAAFKLLVEKEIANTVSSLCYFAAWENYRS